MNFNDSMNAVFQAIRGCRRDGAPFWRSRKFSHFLPGVQCTLSKGSQRFGSGGYSATWAIDGNFTTLWTADKGNDFIGDDQTMVIIQGPFAVVRQSKGDQISMEGRDWSWVGVVAPEDEYKDMVKEVITEVSALDFDECKKWLERCLPDEVRSAVRARKDSLAMEKSIEDARRRKEADDDLWEECLEKGRRYAGDERTAETVARQLYADNYQY